MLLCCYTAGVVMSRLLLFCNVLCHWKGVVIVVCVLSLIEKVLLFRVCGHFCGVVILELFVI